MQWSRQAAGRIFISYRRSDTRGEAGRVSDTLSDYFGAHRVFRDIEGIEGGADFGRAIESNLSTADAVIVLIGPNWLAAADDEGRHRLYAADDWVAAEIAAALEGDIPVFPVLIEGTTMPREDELPERLKPLAQRNAISISDERWKSDTTRLAKIIGLDIPGSIAERRLNRTRALIVAMLLAALAYTTAVFTISADNLLEDERMQAEAAALLAEGDGGSTNELLLAAWAVALNFIAIVASAILLLVSAPMIDPDRRRWIYAGGILGLAGALLGLVMYLVLDVQSETVGLYFVSTITISGMLGSMTLSGFKPK